MQEGKRCQTTGGRTMASAVAKAEQVLQRLDSGAALANRKKVGDVLELYITHIERNQAANTVDKSRPDLRKAMDPYRSLRCEELNRKHLRDACDRSRTETSAARRRSRLRAFVKWGYQQDYFAVSQTQLLNAYTWTPPPNEIVRPSRSFQPKPTGEAARFVTPDQVPSHKAVANLGDALQELLPTGKLMVETVHATGLRIAESYASDGPGLDLDERALAVDWQILSLSGLATRRARPKYGRVRTTNFADVTLTGFHLYDALGERLDQTDFEQRRGYNPKRLLFPAPQGGWWWETGFVGDFFAKAADAAGWDHLDWTDDAGEHRIWVHTMHSLRHRFARDRIDHYGHTVDELQIVGGWKSAQVIWESYYGLSSDSLARSSAKLRERRRP
jgi:integrase